MTAKELKASILDLAIRGKLVPQDPNDEPAENLLARIAAEKAKLVKFGKLKKEKPLPPITDDDKPFDLPRGWGWCRLGEVCDSIADGDHQPPPQVERGVPFLVISNVSGGQLSFDKVRHVGESYFASLADNRKAGKGDILFTVTGSYGIPVVVDQDVDFCFQRHIALLKFRRIDLMYLYYGLSSALIKRQCDIVATGIAQKTVSISSLRNMILPLPPLAEQKRIVEKIEQLMPLVERYGQAEEKRRQLITALPEALKKSILKSAVEGKLVPQDPNDEPAEKLLARIAAEKAKLVKSGKLKKDKTESVIFRGADRLAYETRNGETVCIEDELPFKIPDSWAWARLKSLAAFWGGHTPSLANKSLWGNDYLWISSKDMKTKYIIDTGDKLSCKGRAELVLHPVGTLVVTTRSGILKRALPVAILKKEATINQDQKAITPHLPELAEYIYLTIKGQEYRILADHVKKGTTVQSILWDEFINLLVPIPPASEQTRIIAAVDKALQQLDRLI